MIFCYKCISCGNKLELNFPVGRAPKEYYCTKCNSLGMQRDFVSENVGFILVGGGWPGKTIKEDATWDKKTDHIEAKRKIGKYGKRKGFYNEKMKTHDNRKIMDEWSKMQNGKKDK